IGYGISAIVVFPLVYVVLGLITKEFSYFDNKLRGSHRILGCAFSLLKGLVVVVLLSSALGKMPIQSHLVESSLFIRHMSLYPLEESSLPKGQ
ncbi:MAG: CvpA family protein, partial [Planctomycetes bacterium]|nr:CvpA family protein [Planctomycetota bacterium]